MYKILPYTYKRAQEIGVIIKPSKNIKYKLEVYDSNGNFLFNVGAYGFSDFPNYILSHGIDYANKRRELYKKRHQRDRVIRGTKGWYADNLLW
jgi:hypothetical protein